MSQPPFEFIASWEKQRLLGEFQYAAGSWKYERRVIVNAEDNRPGSDPRFVVTNNAKGAGDLYD